MKHAPTRSARRASARKPAARPFDPTDFQAASLRHRHDGWTPQRQVDFIAALSECGCVDAACRRVGISTTAAYALRGRVEAQSYRIAWDLALDHAIQRLSDAAYSRAIHGVAQPVFYKGEQIGERRKYDERLTQFLLRYRDPQRYGAWLDTCRAERAPDAAAIQLSKAMMQVEADAYARDDGAPLPPPFYRHVATRFVSADEQERMADEAAARRERAQEDAVQAERDLTFAAHLRTLSGADVVATSPTSAPGRP
ncbi:hypothetical protein FHT00_002156 [Sphingomonas insulae]|uniref:Uncharacterized protein n=1 Tax=Sphingomonas insulae TaxID=424800 RepID=A0ABN1HMM0_9SPHN|nr:hypothetical protein [Sphingomonas insulae]NIJ30193.1 hypothetical protein [Sphingomonas insulae]